MERQAEGRVNKIRKQGKICLFRRYLSLRLENMAKVVYLEDIYYRYHTSHSIIKVGHP